MKPVWLYCPSCEGVPFLRCCVDVTFPSFICQTSGYEACYLNITDRIVASLYSTASFLVLHPLLSLGCISQASAEHTQSVSKA